MKKSAKFKIARFDLDILVRDEMKGECPVECIYLCHEQYASQKQYFLYEFTGNELYNYERLEMMQLNKK